MTNDNQFKPINKQFKEPNLPKTYEQFILEEKDLSQQDLYPDLDYQDISLSRGYGPMETKTASSENRGCSHKSTFRVNTIVGDDYYLAYADGVCPAIFEVARGVIKDKDFSGIQKRIDDFKSGKLKVYKYKDSSRSHESIERTLECSKFEGYFEASLENALEELKKAPDYGGFIHYYNFVRP